MRFDPGAIGAIKRHNHRYTNSTLNTVTVKHDMQKLYVAFPLKEEYRAHILKLSNNEVDARVHDDNAYFLIESRKRWLIVSGRNLDIHYRVIDAERGVLRVVKK